MTTIAASKIPTIGASIGATLPAAGAPLDPILDPSNPDLIMMYTMDDISGTVLGDESPNNRDGTLVGGISAVSGLIGNALRGDGIDDRVILPAIGLSGNFPWSLSCWVRRQADDFLYIIGTGGPANGAAINIFIGDTTRSIITVGVIGHDVKSTLLAPTPGDNNWQHFAITYTGVGNFTTANCLLYHNNILLAGTNVGGVVAPAYSDVGGNIYAAEDGSAGSIKAGDVDQWRFFNKVLSVAEINTLYNGGAGA